LSLKDHPPHFKLKVVYKIGGWALIERLWYLHTRTHPAYAIRLYLKVKVTIRDSPDSPEITIRELGKGDFFGEKALLG